MKKFDASSVQCLREDDFWFECSMVSACSPIFSQCYDNYDVELVLRKAGVLLDEDETDTETCALVVLFKTKESGLAFIERLNGYLQAKVLERYG